MTRWVKKPQPVRPARPARPEEGPHSPLDPPLLIPAPARSEPEWWFAELEWREKLMGKKLCDGPAQDDMSYSKDDLPEQKRILAGDYTIFYDWQPFRINVYIGEDDKVAQVWFG